MRKHLKTKRPQAWAMIRPQYEKALEQLLATEFEDHFQLGIKSGFQDGLGEGLGRAVELGLLDESARRAIIRRVLIEQGQTGS